VADGGELTLDRGADDTLTVRLAGGWRLQGGILSDAEVERALATAPPPRRLAFDARGLGRWDTSLVVVLDRLLAHCERQGVAVERSGLPEGVQRLLALAEAVPEKVGARRETMEASILERVGLATTSAGKAALEFLAFVGEVTLAVGRLLRGRARYRTSDLLLVVQQAGAQALPIVTLISFLVGLILAFVGAVQLLQFGAAIYVANLVGIAMVREMGAMMTGIVMAGRTGAAFAAELGTMKVTQEIDALRTMGISPIDFLVLPRMLALSLMLPLLCIYADFVGMLGGAAVGTTMLQLSPISYYTQTVAAITMKDLVGGVAKASVYGVLIAIAGCLRGMQCGNSSSAVGEAATAAVVTGIVLIICSCGLFAVLFYLLGI